MTELVLKQPIKAESRLSKNIRRNKEELKMKVNMGIRFGSYRINLSINRSYEAVLRRFEQYQSVKEAIRQKDDRLTEYGMYNYIA